MADKWMYTSLSEDHKRICLKSMHNGVQEWPNDEKKRSENAKETWQAREDTTHSTSIYNKIACVVTFYSICWWWNTSFIFNITTVDGLTLNILCEFGIIYYNFMDSLIHSKSHTYIYARILACVFLRSLFLGKLNTHDFIATYWLIRLKHRYISSL